MLRIGDNVLGLRRDGMWTLSDFVGEFVRSAKSGMAGVVLFDRQRFDRQRFDRIVLCRTVPDTLSTG
jgi:hypothetical protein